MKRWILIILLFLLLVSGGAVVNVAVAWGSAIWSSWPRTSRHIGVEDYEWPLKVPSDWPERPDVAYRSSHLLLTRTFHSVTMADDEDREYTKLWSCYSGVPMRCLWSVTLREKYRDQAWTITGLVGWEHEGLCPPPAIFGLEIAEKRSLPIMVLWPGFVVDTVFYAVLLWLAFIGARYGRRYLRLKRGLCPMCKYDLRGAPGKGCPECGWKREGTS